MISKILCKGLEPYGPLDYRTAARTLFLRPYLAHFCPVFSRFFAVFSVLTPGFQKVAPKDRGPVPQRSKTAEERVVAADRFLMDRYTVGPPAKWSMNLTAKQTGSAVSFYDGPYGPLL